MLEKTCSHCACRLPVSEFIKDSAAKPTGKSMGVGSRCKLCSGLARVAWKRNNPDKARASRRKARQRTRAKKALARWGGPYVPPVGLRVADPLAWSVKKRLERKAYKLKLLGATPAWSDQDEVRMWYEVATVLSRGGVEFHVDHVVPLRSKLVCGLHAHTNLTVLPWHVNTAKGNRHWPGMPDA